MPCKTKSTAIRPKAEQPQFPVDLLDQFISGAVTRLCLSASSSSSTSRFLSKR